MHMRLYLQLPKHPPLSPTLLIGLPLSLIRKHVKSSSGSLKSHDIQITIQLLPAKSLAILPFDVIYFCHVTNFKDFERKGEGIHAQN